MPRTKLKNLSAHDKEELREFADDRDEVRALISNQKLLGFVDVNYKCKTENQKKLVKSIKENIITICSGYPGSGKTYLSCAVALDLLKKDGYDKIVIAKSVQTIQNEEIGFLKGTMSEKLEPTIQSFVQNINKIIGRDKTKMLFDKFLIEVMPLAYIRGATRDNEIIIIDEAQNISVENIRTVLTRIGENSKMILLGDEEQIDLKKKNDSSLKFIKENLRHIDGIGVVELGEDDVVRHPIIKEIEEVFREKSNKR